MINAPPSALPQPSEANIKSILEWLALAHERSGNDDSEALHQQLLLLRQSPIPTTQHLKLLNLLFSQAEKVVNAELPMLRDIVLPVSRKLRQRIRNLTDLLATLTQDYFNSLADLFDPQGSTLARAPQTSLRRVMYCIAWQIRISHLAASPPGPGLWQQLHAAYRTTSRLGLTQYKGPHDGESIEQIYSGTLLSAIAQPASFCSSELEFIYEYIAATRPCLALSATPTLEGTGIFWIDPDKDYPAYALVRRSPSADGTVLFFSCDPIVRSLIAQIDKLEQGESASSLGLPRFAETRAGKSVLKRLQGLWGTPARRKFPRRRQSYRVNLSTGLDRLWHLIKSPENCADDLSEWMVTNESPDGFALMHMSGHAHHVRVGDIVAIQPMGERLEAEPLWHVSIVRWALSENPEHIELGLQLIASRAIAAEITQAANGDKGVLTALVLPKTPPLRPNESLIVANGALKDQNACIVVLVEGDNLEIREVLATHLDEQTNSIQVFSVSPVENP